MSFLGAAEESFAYFRDKILRFAQDDMLGAQDDMLGAQDDILFAQDTTSIPKRLNKILFSR
jgi:hypothetical protein